ncbi:MAG: helix-turn-helix domain-containing protein [Jatrophihabitans sp.]
MMQLRSREALIECLEFSGMSERELARAANLGHATVNHLFTGRRRSCSLGTARAIERVFNCSPGSLFAPNTDADRMELHRLISRQARAKAGSYGTVR